MPTAERAAWLAQQCDDDADLRDEAARMARALAEPDLQLEESVLNAALHACVSSALGVGDRIGAYRVLEVLGEGGMGVVYRAERDDGEFRQAVAIKVVRMGLGTGPGIVARFRAERQMLATITHPNIARLLDGGITAGGLPYLVLEFVQGQTITDFARDRKLPERQRLRLFQQVCAAVQYAHQNLIVHRDLKPANTLVTPASEVKLLDFGIAKLLLTDNSVDTSLLTRATERLMTPEYASPEQICGDRITTATDVYGLGVLLYELLSGHRPFILHSLSAREAQLVVTERAATPPSQAGLQGTAGLGRLHRATDLDRIVLKAMHKQPERRYASVLELSADIDRHLSGFPVYARPDSTAYRTRRFLLRHKLGSLAAAGFLLTVLSLSVLLAVQARRARQEAASADAVAQYLIGLFSSAQPDSTQGRSTSARELLDTGVAHLDSTWTGDLTAKARLLTTLGSVYYQLGALPQAKGLFEQSRTIYRHLPNRDPAALADLLNSLGEVELDNGDYDESLRDYSESVRLFSQYRPQSSELADSMDGLSGILWETGDFAASERYHLQAISMASRVIGPDAPMTLVDKNNLAVLYVDMGRYREAERIDRDVLATRQRIFGEHNSHTASSTDHLGLVLEYEGRYNEAFPLLMHALELRRSLYGAEHPRIAVSLMHLSQYFRETGRSAEAERYARAALDMSRKLQTDRSLDVAAAEDELGLAELASNRTAEARTQLEHAFKLRSAQHVQNLSLLSRSYDHLGLLDLADRQYAAAQASFEHALQLRNTLFKSPNDQIITSHIHLGTAYLLRGQAAQATQAFSQALQLERTALADKSARLESEAQCGLTQAQIALAYTGGNTRQDPAPDHTLSPPPCPTLL